eukprot:2575928-Prymnesium_polylepis.1
MRSPGCCRGVARRRSAPVAATCVAEARVVEACGVTRAERVDVPKRALQCVVADRAGRHSRPTRSTGCRRASGFRESRPAHHRASTHALQKVWLPMRQP